eukprot:TRINITY_DN1235_c1_g3_i1.p1 TRINITY_DN1235_c1_g3~~TRINITY_DN1235_c1_g3_i1.p1  ORF type:complete len:368 (+),score=76.54 TRINITY_DN1235_c1_g3_i1:66-1169(+)
MGKKKNKKGSTNHSKVTEEKIPSVPRSEPTAPATRETFNVAGSDSIIVRCPSHRYDSTISFYREIMGFHGEYHGKDICKIDWGKGPGTGLWIQKVDRLSHPSIWLVVETNDTELCKNIINSEDNLTMREVEADNIAEGVGGFWVSPECDLIHLVKRSDMSIADAIGTAKTVKASSPPPDSVTEDNPLLIGPASHAPAGHRGKIDGCDFKGGCNIAVKCPSTKYLSTVAFYRETLGLKILHYCPSCTKMKWSNTCSLWVDCLPSLTSHAVWLEINTSSTDAARGYLKGRKRVSMRPEVEIIPPGVDGFWISPPNDMVHLIRGPDGQDQLELAPGDLAETPLVRGVDKYFDSLQDAEKKPSEEESKATK